MSSPSPSRLEGLRRATGPCSPTAASVASSLDSYISEFFESPSPQRSENRGSPSRQDHGVISQEGSHVDDSADSAGCQPGSGDGGSSSADAKASSQTSESGASAQHPWARPEGRAYDPSPGIAGHRKTALR